MGTQEEDVYTIQVTVTGPEMTTGVRTEDRFFAVSFHGWERNINSSLGANMQSKVGSP